MATTEETMLTTNTGEQENFKAGDSLGKRAIRRLMSQKQVIASAIVLLSFLVIALFGYLGLLPDFQERIAGSYAPAGFDSIGMILGTDLFGRSVFFKILAGAKTAVTMGFLVSAIAIPIGVVLGMVAGYYGGKIDAVVVWMYSVLVSIPYILLIIAISYVLGKGLFAICVALGTTSWVGLTRLIRGEVMKHKNREYALASRLLGANNFLIMFKHIFPNVVHLAIVTASLQVLSAIKSEVILTYLGVGIQDGSSWGAMISDAPGELTNGIWQPLFGVVLAMFLIIYSLNVLGDALRDALDPKLLD